MASWLLWLAVVASCVPGVSSDASAGVRVQRVQRIHDADGACVARVLEGVDEATGKSWKQTERYWIDTENPTGYSQTAGWFRTEGGLEEKGGGTSVEAGAALMGLSPMAEVGWHSRGSAEVRARYFVADGHGSIRVRAGPDGRWSGGAAEYDAFGLEVGGEGSAPVPGAGEATEAPLQRGYAGERTDKLLGLQDLRARTYAPGLGRFQTLDTFEGRLTDPGSLHKYLYCQGNPVNRVDPSGHEMTAPSMTSVTGTIGGMARMTLPAVGRAFVHSRNLIGRSMVQATRLRMGDPTQYVMSRLLGAALSVGTVEAGLGLALSLDEAGENEEGGVLYRAMSGRSLPDLLPEGETRRSTFLGIRPDDAYVENGLALPFDRSMTPQGLSVTPDNPSVLPQHVLRKIAGGDVRVWGLYRRMLDPRLEYRPDPRRPKEHGLVGPRIAMPLEEFRTLIRETQGQWSPLTQ